MTGRPIDDFFPKVSFNPGEVRLAVSNLTTRDRRVRDVSIEVRGGEIVGLAGLVGCGKSEIGRACFGVEEVERGTIEFMGKPLARLSAGDNLARGLSYVPPAGARACCSTDRPGKTSRWRASIFPRCRSGRCCAVRPSERSPATSPRVCA